MNKQLFQRHYRNEAWRLWRGVSIHNPQHCQRAAVLVQYPESVMQMSAVTTSPSDGDNFTSLADIGRVEVEVHGAHADERNVPLFCGPVSDADPTGTGIVVDQSTARVTQILPNGIAQRWNELRVGDEILSVSSAPYRRGASLQEHLVAGKDSYLLRVLRVRSSESLAIRLARSVLPTLPERVWTSEEQVAAAWADAGDYQKGLR